MKPGINARANRIALAVADEEWQDFRRSLKGIPTVRKLEKLREYFEANVPTIDEETQQVIKHGGSVSREIDDVIIRVDNYIKALCRGGQLRPGESLQSALSADWNLLVKK